MKIVLLTPQMHGRHGWSRASLDLARGLQARGHTVTALVAEPSENSGIPEEVVLRPETQLMSNPYAMLVDSLKVRRALKRLQPDVVHVIAEPFAILLTTVPWKTCITFHGTFAAVPFHGNFFLRTLMTRAVRRAYRIITVSAFTKKYLLQHAGPLVGEAFLEKKICVIPNAVDLSRFPLDTPAETPNTLPLIVTIGAVKPRKNILRSIEACALLKKQGVPFRYDIVGSLSQIPHYVKKVEEAIARLGLQAEVRLRGEVDEGELQHTLRSADVLLMPSIAEGLQVEGFGIVFLEANALGIPAIGPKSGGCPEAILDGKTGYVVDPYNEEAIAQALTAVLQKKTIARADCRAWAEAHSMEKIAQMVESAYE